MVAFFTKSIAPFYETESEMLICEDTFKALKAMKAESVDMIFADPPYFLSNDGVTCQAGRMVSVNKGSWKGLKLSII